MGRTSQTKGGVIIREGGRERSKANSCSMYFMVVVRVTHAVVGG
jgi:hypothetical protein